MDTENGSPLQPSSRGFGIVHDAWGRLVLIDADGRQFVGVEPVRTFPFSDPASWIAICDAEGREIVCVESLADLPAPVRQTLEQELAVREFVPTITRIVRVTSDRTPSDWTVLTDRGTTQFTLDSEDDVRRLGSHRILIADNRRLRYHIPDTRALDAGSRRILERFA